MKPTHQDFGARLAVGCRNTLLDAAELLFDSFEVCYGYGWRLSAADAVYALVALITQHARGNEERRVSDAKGDFWCVN